MEQNIEHLKMIQDIISRMAKNTFALKGWAVTLVSGLFALVANNANYLYYLIAYIPVITFWLLDAYYLKQERLYRSLYNDIRTQKSTNFEMETAKYKKYKTNRYVDCLISISQIFYLPLAVAPIIVVILSK